MLRTLSFILLSLLTSCTFADIGKIAAEEAFKQISDIGKTDSVVVKFNPVYFKVDLLDTLDYEKNIEMSGYNLWLLRTGNTLRIEVCKSDTIVEVPR